MKQNPFPTTRPKYANEVIIAGVVTMFIIVGLCLLVTQEQRALENTLKEKNYEQQQRNRQIQSYSA